MLEEQLFARGTRMRMKSLVIGLAIALLGAGPALGADTRTAIDPELRELLRKAASESDSFDDRFDGEVWLTDMSQRLETRVPDHDFRIELLKTVHYEARRAGLEPELVLAVIQVESNFDPYAISRVGALGLMQVMPFWLKEIGKPGDNLFRPHTNLRYGCTILKHYLDKEKGNRTRALMRYNGTKEWRYPKKVYKAFDTRWKPH